MARCEFIDDLIPLILESNDHWWPRDLVALATVSPSWLFYSRKRLYSFPTIHSFPAAKLLARTFTENAHLRALVTGVCLRPMVGEQNRRSPQAAELKGLRLLLGLEGLRRIVIGGELAVKAERFLRLIGNPDGVEDIHVDGSLLSHRMSSRPSLEWDEGLAFGFQSLKKLRLTDMEVDIIAPSIDCPSTITDLVLENVHIIHGQVAHILNGVRSINCLHVSTKDATASNGHLGLVLASCMVKCLHYELQKDSGFVLDINSEGIGTLECLHLKGVYVDLGVLNSVSEACRNLRELVVSGRAVRVTGAEWAGYIRSGAFSELERLGLPWGTNRRPFIPWPPAEVEEIREACARRRLAVY
ncbi:hypothetical protein M413DRAFT_439711 [Hebeloma cylindrosporum]|uniref:F-box domain-containing protein n=1 Tax=Hebeloma cylindrosporum TaxID=76867 RepID=A0A0C3CVY6_HEBCY|nr:hypothetical protein M413DRAFT_439711 [Hebeloma cylindrosporum h7]